MKYNVKFSCGHEEVRELFGKVSEREKRIAYWQAKGICSECYKKIQEEKRKEQEAKLEEKSAGLPELEGTEKQVAWAKKIRLEKIEQLTEVLSIKFRGKPEAFIAKYEAEGRDKLIETIKSKVSGETAEKAIADLVEMMDTADLLKEFKTTTSAKWIIEHR